MLPFEFWPWANNPPREDLRLFNFMVFHGVDGAVDDQCFSKPCYSLPNNNNNNNNSNSDQKISNSQSAFNTFI